MLLVKGKNFEYLGTDDKYNDVASVRSSAFPGPTRLCMDISTDEDIGGVSDRATECTEVLADPGSISGRNLDISGAVIKHTELAVDRETAALVSTVEGYPELAPD